MRSFRTYEDVQEHVFVEQDKEVCEAALQELAMLQSRLVDLKNFNRWLDLHNAEAMRRVVHLYTLG